MHSLSSVLGVTISVAIFIPFPSLEHFVWPLSNCVLADICNHTWIPECGLENSTDDRRLFIDECDMFEYNCDKSRSYEVTNYTECFGPATGCPTLPKNVYRRGNYKFVLEGRKMIYDPTIPHTHATIGHYRRIVHPTTRPMLPRYMFQGKRRHTPEATKRRQKPKFHTRSFPVKKTIRKLRVTTKKLTVVLKRVTVMKNGRMMVKVVKGYADTSSDSDFLQ